MRKTVLFALFAAAVFTGGCASTNGDDIVYSTEPKHPDWNERKFPDNYSAKGFDMPREYTNAPKLQATLVPGG